MTYHEMAATVQMVVSLLSFLLGAVGIRAGRYTVGGLGWFLGAFFGRLAVGNFGRDNPDFDFVRWSASGPIVLGHNVIIAILLVGVIVEFYIRELSTAKKENHDER